MNITAQPGYSAKVVKNEFIFSNPPFAACHASTIAELAGNRLMVAWFGGAYEGNSDVAIWITSCSDGKWSKPEKVATGYLNDSVSLPCWNPVLFKTLEGKLYLFYKVGKSPREWWGMVKQSDNDGRTWSESEPLPDGFLGPIKDKPVQLKTGEILCPSSTESSNGKRWQVYIEITDNDLIKWKKIPVGTNSSYGVIQPCILWYPGDKLQLLCRSRENCIMQSWSFDRGMHWTELKATEVHNPNSGIDAVTLDNGLQLLVYNPTVSGKEWSDGRNILSVALSEDGIHWKDIYTPESQKEGEFSYPAVVQTSDGLVHITYTWNRKNIKHIVLKINKKLKLNE